MVFYHPEYPYYDWCLKNIVEVTASPFSVSLTTGTVVTTNTIACSDHYDSLLVTVNEVAAISSGDLVKFTDPLTYDPYWATTGIYYNNGSSPAFTPSSTVSQLSSTPSTYPWDTKYASANSRFSNYLGTGISLPQVAAVISTSCANIYGQPVSGTVVATCLTSGYGITSGMDAQAIINVLPTTTLQNTYWENFRSLYMVLKQEFQQESAESYVMNSDNYRGCNDCIGDRAFDEFAFTVPFTDYSPFGIFAYADVWFFPFNPVNQAHYCATGTNYLYSTKIRRFPNAKSGLDLADLLPGGDPGSSIYASTGLCPNAFYLQTLLNTMGIQGLLPSASFDLGATPEFNKDLYTIVAGGVMPAVYASPTWTAAVSTISLTAQMQVGANPPCALTLDFPSGSSYDWTNTGFVGSTYDFIRLYSMAPTGTIVGGSSFEILADISYTSMGIPSVFTTTLTGNNLYSTDRLFFQSTLRTIQCRYCFAKINECHCQYK